MAISVFLKRTLGPVLCAIVAWTALPALAAPKPNIIIVMADDMGYGDLGVTGNPVIRTPNINHFAAESAGLTQFYVSPVCSPTRACLMTGRYNYRTRVIDTFKGRSMMDPGEVTIAEALKPGGYTTGIFGKWHLGDNHPMRPQEQGFDEVLVLRGGGLAQPSEPIANHQRYTDSILFHNGEPVQTKGYCTDVYFDAAMKFMRDAKRQGKPFFVYLPPNAPHGPFHDVPEELLKYYQSVDLDPVLGEDKSDRHRDQVARIYAMVENIDQNMGRLETFLKEEGLRENTLVMFLTDNGPATRRYVGPFRGMKTEVHEGGVHTCFFARWPGHFTAGYRNDRLAAHIDILPTVLEVAGVPQPKDVKLDGRSVLSLLTGTARDWPDRTLVFQSHRGDTPVSEHNMEIRSQDWKLVHQTGFGREALPPNVGFELYRVMDDPAEQDNLADRYPLKVLELREAYARWFADVSSTRPDNYAPPRIDIGVPAEPVVDLSIQDWRVPPDAQGWGAGGQWFVNVRDAGPYKIEVQFDEAPGQRKLELQIGDRTLPLQLADGTTSVSATGIKLATGEATVRVNSTPAFQRQQIPRFVTFQKE